MAAYLHTRRHNMTDVPFEDLGAPLPRERHLREYAVVLHLVSVDDAWAKEGLEDIILTLAQDGIVLRAHYEELLPESLGEGQTCNGHLIPLSKWACPELAAWDSGETWAKLVAELEEDANNVAEMQEVPHGS